jgi:hypothetical protein
MAGKYKFTIYSQIPVKVTEIPQEGYNLEMKTIQVNLINIKIFIGKMGNFNSWRSNKFSLLPG